ncbi:MAG: sugar-binding protein, partial [Lentisphaeria bacterium]
EFWLDLDAVGSPDNWNGRLWLGALYQDGAPNRVLELKILETCETLPEGAIANKVFPLKGGKTAVSKKIIKLPFVKKAIKLDGKLDEAEWTDALEFRELTRLSSPGIEAPPTKFQMLRDDKNLYIAAELTPVGENGFQYDELLRPWYCDSIEVYLQCRDAEEAFVQYIIATNRKTYAMHKVSKQAGATSKPLSVPEYKAAEMNGKWCLEMKIPLAVLGTGADRSGFNLCRSVWDCGNAIPYTLAPGREFRNMEAFELDWK